MLVRFMLGQVHSLMGYNLQEPLCHPADPVILAACGDGNTDMEDDDTVLVTDATIGTAPRFLSPV